MMKFAPLAVAAAALLPLPAAAQDASTVVATVGETEITLGHMIALRERLPQQYQSLPDDTLFTGVLDQLVQQQALAEGGGELSTAGQLIIENETRALLAPRSSPTPRARP